LQFNLKNIPGNNAVKDALQTAASTKNFAHALLFNGNEGSGNLPLSISFAKAVLCPNVTENGPCNTCQSCKNVDKLSHPDLHFSFPFISSVKNKISDASLATFKSAVIQNPFLSVNNWFELLEPGKQGVLTADESHNIIKKLSLKSFSGGYKVMIIWRPEFQNASAANRLLKIIEEPPEKTIFILVSEKREEVISTILSRCQLVKVSPPVQPEIEKFLINSFSVEPEKAKLISALADGNVGRAIEMLNNEAQNLDMLDRFVQLNRLAYKRDIASLMSWSEELAAIGREKQKLFLHYCLHLTRLSIRANFLNAALDNLSNQEKSFLAKFAPYVNHNNVIELNELFNKAHYAVVRNGNAKMIFLNLTFGLIPLIHPKNHKKSA
jgi:DNA polymerase-3 subunit delta'